MAETKKEAPKIEKREIVKNLCCKLTDTEILKYGRDLATLNQQIDTAEARKKSVVKQLDSDLAALEAQRAGAAEKVARGEEFRDVKVTTVRDYENRTYHEKRHDTGEIINTRPLRDDERQPGLPGTGSGGKG